MAAIDAISANLGWHLKQILAGRLGLAEFASKMLIVPEFSAKAKLLGMRPDLLVSLMSDAVLQTLKRHAAIVISDRTPNAKIKQILKDEFREAYYGFAKTYPSYASETLRTLYIEHLSEQRDRLDSEVQEFTLGIEAATEKPALPVKTLQRLHTPPTTATGGAEPAHIGIKRRHAFEYRYTETIENRDTPGAVQCPNCGLYGFRAIYRTTSAGRKVIVDGIRHTTYKPDGHSIATFYHMVREIDEDTAGLLKQEYKQQNTQAKLNTKATRQQQQQALAPTPPAAAVSGHKIGEPVICPKCQQPGKLTERTVRDTRYMWHYKYAAVTHKDGNNHKLKILEKHRLTEAERDQILQTPASKARRRYAGTTVTTT
jgi:hypothetical protein